LPLPFPGRRRVQKNDGEREEKKKEPKEGEILPQRQVRLADRLDLAYDVGG
jgi:hypothetical protein